MPRQHSELYRNLELLELINDHKISPNLLNRSIWDRLLPSDGYDQLSDLLRENNDAQFGIVSNLNKQGEWVRDATNAVSLAGRISHDSPVIEANNTLLRCLSRLRPIDYAIKKKHDAMVHARIRDALQRTFLSCFHTILSAANETDWDDTKKLKEIDKLEKKFNTFLVKALHEANLTNGCDNAKDAEDLLFHYRNLSSLMEPARTMITLTYDDTAKVFQRETQYPVTEKTNDQKEAINQLKKIQPHPFEKEKNAHNCRNIASQEADKLFADLMQDDTRALSAQARKTHLVGAKNAFIVKNELIRLEKKDLPDDLTTLQATKENTLWLARSGVPVYVGKGEKSDNIQKHTQENLEQIRIAAQKRMDNPNRLNIHITCLNTVSPLENQDIMVKHLYKATRDNPSKQDNISYAPTNPDGTFRAIDLAPGLFSDDDTKPGYTAPLQKKDRLDAVATIMLQAANQDDSISLVQCASGQDRTGTAVEKATQEWMAQRYAAMNNLRTDNIEIMRALGGNAAEITSHHIHGSPGMKTDSKANNAFGNKRAFENTEDHFYLKSAKTNKTNHINENDITFLQKPRDAAIKEYRANLESFQSNLAAYKQTINGDENKQKFYDMGVNVLENVIQITGGNSRSLDSKSLADLNTVLPHCNTLLNQDIKSPEAQESLRRLASLSNKVSGKAPPLWKALGVGLLTFACLALVVGGILAAVPSGGSSLLLTVAGVAGLGGGLLGASAIGTAAGTLYGREKGLAKSLTDFKSALEHIKKEEPPVGNDDSPKI